MMRHPLEYSITAMRAAAWKGVNFKLSAQLAAALDKVRPSLVYVNWSWATCGSVMYACMILGLPFVFSVRGTDITPPASNFPLRVRMARRILTPAAAYVEILTNGLGVPAEKVRLVRNCLGTEAFEQVKSPRDTIDGPIRLLSIGTLRPVKRHSDLIQCCRILKDRAVAFECRIFGDGPDRQLLQNLIDTLGLGESVALKGHVPQERLPEQFEWCDIYVHPSESEGLGHTILEAQASGRPLVLADGKGGIRESVLAGKTAMMVPVGKPEEIAGAVLNLAAEPRLRAEMGKAGREFVMQEFSHKRFAKNFLDALFS
jgi:glycosyltransferase involved in cell wall biosynthesis